MDGKLRMFLILVGIGFASSVLLSLIPLGQFATCAENGIVPDLGSDAPKCVGFGVPNAFGDESEIKLGEPDYQFIDFSYQNKVGEPIKFVLEMRTSNNCNSYDAKVIHEHGTVIWGEGADVSCAQNDNSEPIISQIKIGYNEKHPLIINESARYLIKITLDHGIIEREFIVRHTISGISLDRTVYPVIPDAPLKQYDSGIPFHEVQCKGGLQKTQRYDGSPACVNPDTYWELIKRDWVSEIIKAVQSRDVYSLHSSYMGNVIPTLDDFRNTLQESADIDVIFSKFGEVKESIIVKKANATRCYGFIKYNDISESYEAIKHLHDKYQCAGVQNKLIVRFAQSKNPNYTQQPKRKYDSNPYGSNKVYGSSNSRSFSNNRYEQSNQYNKNPYSQSIQYGNQYNRSTSPYSPVKNNPYSQQLKSNPYSQQIQSGYQQNPYSSYSNQSYGSNPYSQQNLGSYGQPNYHQQNYQQSMSQKEGFLFSRHFIWVSTIN